MYVKNIIIALSWSLCLTLLPVIDSSLKHFELIYLVLYFYFIKSFINSILFDIRDINGDVKIGIITIPVLWGKMKTKKILLLLNSTLIPWLVFSYYNGFFNGHIFALSIAVAYGYWYILYYCQETIKIGKSLDLIVDGEFILIAILVCFAIEIQIVILFFIIFLFFIYLYKNSPKKCTTAIYPSFLP